MNNIIDQFYKNKKDDSPFITLEDGESIKVRVTKLKTLTKVGFNGEEVEVLRLVCEVATQKGIREKYFDNGSMRWAKELRDNKVAEGSSFTITRDGEGPQTTYEITDATHAAASEPAVAA